MIELARTLNQDGQWQVLHVIRKDIAGGTHDRVVRQLHAVDTELEADLLAAHETANLRTTDAMEDDDAPSWLDDEVVYDQELQKLLEPLSAKYGYDTLYLDSALVALLA